MQNKKCFEILSLKTPKHTSTHRRHLSSIKDGLLRKDCRITQRGLNRRFRQMELNTNQERFRYMTELM
jgi:hypothetical protein